jgi:peptide deformylase
MKIKREGATVLSQVAQFVPYQEDVSELVADMWAVLRQHNGGGLAANQVGVLKRVIVLNTKKFRGSIVNPVITMSSGSKRSEEGCLSFPGRRVTVKRYKSIVVEGFDASWQPVKLSLRGFASFAAQHEIDHLNGITIMDKRG